MIDPQDIILIIGSITVSLTTIIAAIFAGWIALKQLPQQRAELAAVKYDVNSNFSQERERGDRLEGQIVDLQKRLDMTAAMRLDEAKAREAPALQAPSVLQSAPIPVEVVNPEVDVVDVVVKP